MKILEIDYDYYQYPQDISSLEEFIDYAAKHYNSFIKLMRFEEINCVFPYLIMEDTTPVYLNIARINKIQEHDATVLCREEYEARLKTVVAEKCKDCVHYKENLDGDNLEGHRGKISLDGKCSWYEKIEEQDV